MASLAGMLQARGALVTGSDEHVYPPMSTMLASAGIEVKQGYSPTICFPSDCVVSVTQFREAIPKLRRP